MSYLGKLKGAPYYIVVTCFYGIKSPKLIANTHYV